MNHQFSDSERANAVPFTLKLENDTCSTSVHSFQPITVGGDSPFAFLGMSSNPIENLASPLFDRDFDYTSQRRISILRNPII